MDAPAVRADSKKTGKISFCQPESKFGRTIGLAGSSKFASLHRYNTQIGLKPYFNGKRNQNM